MGLSKKLKDDSWTLANLQVGKADPVPALSISLYLFTTEEWGQGPPSRPANLLRLAWA